ncbi:hypothetical protein RND71_001915 [Anisodus tanguticus]|uniref:Uncharacterized protein n=1 Tax=Anisodus tanguticus TaxID=243964 RepID=A0AAE1SYV7_9SOLA|nr:hypothetical protein RND71_001915 [Anisodus tanguticus]
MKKCDGILFESKECQIFKKFDNPLFNENIQEGLKGDLCVDTMSHSLNYPNIDCVIHIDHNSKIDEVQLNGSFLVDLCALDESDDLEFKECMTCKNDSCGLFEGANYLNVSKLTPKIFVESTSRVERSSNDKEHPLKMKEALMILFNSLLPWINTCSCMINLMNELNITQTPLRLATVSPDGTTHSTGETRFHLELASRRRPERSSCLSNFVLLPPLLVKLVSLHKSATAELYMVSELDKTPHFFKISSKRKSFSPTLMSSSPRGFVTLGVKEEEAEENMWVVGDAMRVSEIRNLNNIHMCKLNAQYTNYTMGSSTTCSCQIVNKVSMVMKPTSPTTPTSPLGLDINEIRQLDLIIEEVKISANKTYSGSGKKRSRRYQRHRHRRKRV